MFKSISVAVSILGMFSFSINGQILTDSASTVGLWQMDSIAGGVVPDDDVANFGNRNNNLLLYGTPSLVDGYNDMALEFAGANEYGVGDCGVAGVWENYDSVKVEVVFRPSVLGVSQHLVDVRGVFALYIGSNDKVQWGTGSVNLTNQLRITNTDDWWYACASINASGERASTLTNLTTGVSYTYTDTGVMIDQSGRNIYVGAFKDGTTSFFKGAIDAVKISVPDTIFTLSNYDDPYHDSIGTYGLWHFDSVYINDPNGEYKTADDNSAGWRESNGLYLWELGMVYDMDTAGPAFVGGKDPNFGNAFAFDGINDGLSGTVEINYRNFMVEAWIKIDALKLGFDSVYSISSEYGTWHLYVVDRQEGFSVQWSITQQNDEILTCGSGNRGVWVNNEQWYHVAGSYAYGKLSLYVNGQLVQSKTFAEDLPLKPSEKSLFIGASKSTGTNYPWWGKIDEFRISAAVMDCSIYVPAGDLNEDCRVDFEDYSILAGNWLTDSESVVLGDLSRDGSIDTEDLEIMANHWLEMFE